MKHKISSPTICNGSSRFLEVDCEQCGKTLEAPIIAKKCLHRFCGVCCANLMACPKCGAATQFEQDANLTGLILKVNKQMAPMKRKLLDVLQMDGADLTQSHGANGGGSGRWSRMTNGSSPNKLLMSPVKAKLHAPGPSTSFQSDTAGQNPGTGANRSASRSDGESSLAADGWNKMNSMASHRQLLNRNFAEMEPLVLWPDGVNYRIRDLPHALLRPRYLYVPSTATVAHLAEFLFKRAELEADWKLRNKYRIEFMPVEDEKEEINLWINPRRNIDYLAKNFKSNLQDLQESASNEEYVLILRKNQEDSYFCTNLIMGHPFKPLDHAQTVGELVEQNAHQNAANEGEQCSNMEARQNSSQKEKRAPKFVFRFVQRV